MYIHRLIFRDVRNFAALDLLLWNDWTQQPLQSVLVTGPNGTGKATLLRAIAGLWENFGNWIHLRRALNADQMAQRSLLLDAGLAAVEIRGLQPFPVWLFVASTPAHWEELQSLVADTTARFVGEVRGGRGRPQFVPAEDDNTAEWLRDLTERKERAELGTATPEALPNLLFIGCRNPYYHHAATPRQPRSDHRAVVQMVPRL
jgi:energy-coupling factor transporter ATP-binding protein EcfA2